nr:hypothetical protein CFP56_61213 [Quercus suber]
MNNILFHLSINFGPFRYISSNKKILAEAVSIFCSALCLLVLGGIDSVLGFGDAKSIGVRDEDEAMELGDCEWLRGKGLEIENGVRVGGFDWEGFADLIEVEVGVNAFTFNFVL